MLGSPPTKRLLWQTGKTFTAAFQETLSQAKHSIFHSDRLTEPKLPEDCCTTQARSPRAHSNKFRTPAKARSLERARCWPPLTSVSESAL